MHTRDLPGAPSSGDQGDCTTYYIRPSYQESEVEHIYLIQRNKYKAAAKMGR